MGNDVLAALNWRRHMGGGDTLPQLFECSDGRDWVVKLPGNPHLLSGLCSDWIGTVLAAELGVRVPLVSPVLVDEAALATIPADSAIWAWARAGIGFASLWLDSLDVKSMNQILQSSTAAERARIVVVDTWLDVLDRKKPEALAWNLVVNNGVSPARLTCIDYGMCLTDVFQVLFGTPPMVPRVPTEWRPTLQAPDLLQAIADVCACPSATIESLVKAMPAEWGEHPRLPQLAPYLINRAGALTDCFQKGGLL